jgi:hypothetical protein
MAVASYELRPEELVKHSAELPFVVATHASLQHCLAKQMVTRLQLVWTQLAVFQDSDWVPTPN